MTIDARGERPGPFRSIVDADRASEYRRAGWWGDDTLGQTVRRWAAARPDADAFVSGHGRLDYAGYDAGADRTARALVEIGIRPGERVAVWIPDSGTVHAVMVGAERAGATVVGIGARSGLRDLDHLLERTCATALVTLAEHRGEPVAEVVDQLRAGGRSFQHLVVPYFEVDAGGDITADGVALRGADGPADSDAIGADDLFLINSTSGTTGRPKCVMHFQNRWFYFHQKAVENGALTTNDIFVGAVPAPFGFGLWTSHFTPAILGAPTIVFDRFDAGETLESIERERVTVLSCVSTQFIMMMNHERFEHVDLSSLRVMFTGGEAIPYEKALEFERRTGCTVLQFFGSNETGLLSGTDLDDTPERRLRTAGRIVPEMDVRLYEGDADVTASGRGQPACRGPATTTGYLDDEEANDELFSSDGWMIMGDVCTLDDEGYLTVVGRTSDIIIRGGKNISAGEVEDEVATHPAVAMVGAVAAPDEVFGERVCVFVELRRGATLTFDDLVEHLDGRGTTREIRPELLFVVDEIPRSVGGKVAKAALRAELRRRLLAERT